LVCAAAHFFRGNNLEYAKERVDFLKATNTVPSGWNKKVLNKEEIDFAESLIKNFSNMSDYSVRVESPLLSFYTNSDKDAELVLKLDTSKVKYFSYPESVETETNLGTNKVLTKKIDFDYKITMGRTRDSFISFLDWCENNPKIRMPKRAKRDLERSHSWGGSYFYVKDAKTLTLVKLFVGSYINKVENVVKI
jgi:hypothetical protein